MKKVPGLKEVLERLKSSILFKLDKWISGFQFHYIAANVEKYLLDWGGIGSGGLGKKPIHIVDYN